MRKRREKGFTLIELLVAIGITGIIIWPLATTITTLFTNPQRSADQNVVLHEVRNAGYWVSRDVQMSRTATLGEPNGFPISLDIPVDGDENNDYRVDYVLDGNRLEREMYDSLDILISETLIANHIDSDNATFINLDLSHYKLTIKASRGEVSVIRSYEVSQRL